MKKTLFNKLMITHLIVILISIAVLGVLLPQLLRNYFLDMKKNELLTKGQELSNITAQYFRHELDETTMAYMIKSLERFVDARVWIVDKNGLIRMVSREERCGPQKMMMQRGVQLPPEETVSVLKGKTYVKVGDTPHFDEPMVSVGVPIFNETTFGKQVSGAVFLHAPVTGVTDTLSRVYKFLGLAILVAIILASLLAVYLSKTISKPLHEMTGAALSMAKGEYNTRVKVQTDDEVGELAASFNYMSDKLTSTIDALHNEKSKVESLITSLNEGVVAIDRHGVIVRTNPMAEELMGIPEEAVGNKVASICSEDIAEAVQNVLKDGKVKAVTLKKDEKVLLTYFSPVKDHKGNISGTVCVIQDISEAEKLEQMRRDFVSDVSHELRTPLTAIRGYNEALSDGTATDNESRQKYHNIIREETQRLERLIHDLLDLSRLQSGKISIELEPLQVGAVIKSAVEKLEPQILGKGINLNLEIPENELYILGNEDRLVQLMIILVDNAVHYTNSGGQISVALNQQNSEVELIVKDTGKGIPKEKIPFIWERFYKVDESRTRTKAGTGLGLAIAKKIIQLHKAKIDVESEVGKGTVFKMRFKLVG